MTKRLWLDDERPEPKGWDRARTAAHAVMLLASGTYEEVSLDHDLGPEDAGTGYDVVCWLEKEAMTNGAFQAPIVHVHTDNASARGKMVQAARNIELVRQKQSIGGT